MRDFNQILEKLNKLSNREKYFLENEIHSVNFNDRNVFDVEPQIIMKPDSEGVVTSYPNTSFSDNQFSISRKIRYINIPPHRHEYIEMVYVLDGELQQMIKGQVITMKKGDFCILDKNVIHGSEILNDKDLVINLIFSPEFFDGIFLNLFSDSNIVSNFILNSLYSKNREQNYILLHIDDKSFLQKLFENLIIEFFNVEMRTWSAIYGYLLIIFTELSRLFSDSDHLNTKLDIDMEEEQLKKELLKYIRSNYRDINLKGMAEFFHFHPSYLSSFIKNSFGKNLQDMIIDTRLNKACSLLINTDVPIEEIVFRVGYSNKSYFYKLFKKHYGMTPHQYRIQHSK